MPLLTELENLFRFVSTQMSRRWRFRRATASNRRRQAAPAPRARELFRKAPQPSVSDMVWWHRPNASQHARPHQATAPCLTHPLPQPLPPTVGPACLGKVCVRSPPEEAVGVIPFGRAGEVEAVEPAADGRVLNRLEAHIGQPQFAGAGEPDLELGPFGRGVLGLEDERCSSAIRLWARCSGNRTATASWLYSAQSK